MFTCKFELRFCREWKYFCYEPKIVRFACEVGSLEGRDDNGGINLSQFSSATVPKVRKNNYISFLAIRLSASTGEDI